MDLARCKLVRNSKTKEVEQNSFSAHWSSAEIQSRSPTKLRMSSSKSLEKVYRSSQEASFFNQKKRILNNLSPQMKEKKWLVVLPSLDNIHPLKSFSKPKGLISIKKSSEKEIKPIDWAQPAYRLGFAGGKFSTPKEKARKSQMPKEMKPKNQEDLKESNSDELFIQYKEPYLQHILEKKLKQINYSNALGFV